MVYRKRPPNSRKYIKNQQQSNHESADQNIVIPDEKAAEQRVEELPSGEPSREIKTPKPLGFLSSILGTGERAERSGSPLFTVFNYDIYLDDLLLAGLIILMLTDKVEDELLLIVLLYLLLDIF
ncbi:MAG TPA: hypothetical protein VHP38_13525 [Ruminiclostridium sp.]|nr:hypothetical protein [Ruminiclostridium sp.]